MGWGRRIAALVAVLAGVHGCAEVNTGTCICTERHADVVTQVCAVNYTEAACQRGRNPGRFHDVTAEEGLAMCKALGFDDPHTYPNMNIDQALAEGVEVYLHKTSYAEPR